MEWERQRRQELLTQRNREQESIVLLKARKKTLEFELEALVNQTDPDSVTRHRNLITKEKKQPDVSHYTLQSK